MSELAIGLVGAGRMGMYHLRAWDKIRAGRVLAVADPDERVAHRTIGRRRIAWSADYRELLDRADVDAVCVCTPPALRARIALEAVAAGKHVLVEKPIATELDDAWRLADAGRHRGVKLMVGHVERFNPAVVESARFLAQGNLGRVLRVHATRVGPLPARIPDVGVAIDLATHDLDIMHSFSGAT